MTDSQSAAISGNEVEYCQRRLLSLRSRIEFLWPQSSRGLRGLMSHNGLSNTQERSIKAILASLPALAVDADGAPQAFGQPEDDLLTAIGAVADAGFVLLEDEDLTRIYPKPVELMEPGPDGALALDTLAAPTVGDLISRLLIGLEQIGRVLSGGPLAKYEPVKPAPAAKELPAEVKVFTP
jgi:hypothetical protein